MLSCVLYRPVVRRWDFAGEVSGEGEGFLRLGEGVKAQELTVSEINHCSSASPSQSLNGPSVRDRDPKILLVG